MAEENKDQKTEEASSKKITDTQEKGNFAQSREISSSFVLLASIIAFSIVGKHATETVIKTWYSNLAEMGTINLNIHELFRLMNWNMQNLFFIIGPILIIIMVAGIFESRIVRLLRSLSCFCLGMCVQVILVSPNIKSRNSYEGLWCSEGFRHL